MCLRPEWEGRAPNAIDISYGVRPTRAMLSVFQRLDPSMAQWDLNSQPTCMDVPCAGSLDRKLNDQIHVHCANQFKPLDAFYDAHGYTEDLFFYTPSPDGDKAEFRVLLYKIYDFQNIYKSSWD